MSEGVRGLIITHATLGDGLLAAVRKITGVGEEAVSILSNEGCGPAELIDRIRHRSGDESVVLFTDMAGGSCAVAARKVAAQRPGTGYVGGVNLPLLLDFVYHRDLPLPELVERLVECGRSGILGTFTEETANADHTAPD